MLGLTDWVSILKLILNFPSQVLALAKIVQGTPESQRESVVKQIQAEAEKFVTTGRPDWNG